MGTIKKRQIRFPQTLISSLYIIYFKVLNVGGETIHSIPAGSPVDVMDYVNGIYTLPDDVSAEIWQNIKSSLTVAVYKRNLPGLNEGYEIDYVGGLFKINKSIIAEDMIYGNILAPDGTPVNFPLSFVYDSDDYVGGGDPESDKSLIIDNNTGTYWEGVFKSVGIFDSVHEITLKVDFDQWYLIDSFIHRLLLYFKVTILNPKVRWQDYMKIEVLTINGWQEVYFNSDSAENEYAPTVGIAGADLEFWMSGSQGVLPGEAITENNQIIIRFDPVYALGLRANFKTQITNQGAINAYRLYEMSIKGYSNILPVKASFYYQAKSIAPGSDANDPTNNPKNLIDGNYGTQLQTVYETESLRGMNYITIDMGLDDEGNLQKVDAIDMVSGFLELNNTRYNIKNRYTLQYSTDGVNFYPISKNA